MPAERTYMGLFADEARAATAITALADQPWRLVTVHGPIPSQQIAAALGQKKSRLGYFTLSGGILGFFSGVALAAFTASRWSLMVSGKPVVAWVPFFIVGFEFTILFAVIGNVAGLITQMGLPRFKGSRTYDPRCSADRFGIVVACETAQQEALARFFEHRGATIRELSAADPASGG